MDIETYRNLYAEPLDYATRKLEKLFPGKVSSRLKTAESIAEKLHRRNLDITETTDIAGARVIFTNVDSLFAGLTKIRNNFDVVQEENYIEKPKGNYRSYHLLVNVSGLPIEIQLKTNRQLEWGEIGHKELPLYKSREELQSLYGKNLKKLEKYYNRMSAHYYFSDIGQKLKRPKVPSIWKRLGLPMLNMNPVRDCPVCGYPNVVKVMEFRCEGCGEELIVRFK